MPRKRSTTTLNDLISAGVLMPGEELTCELKQKGENYTARLLTNGRIEYEGNSYSVSGWVSELYGSSQNGWINVIARGQKLDAIRKRYDNGLTTSPVSSLPEPTPKPEPLSEVPQNNASPDVENLKSEVAILKSRVERLNTKLENLLGASTQDGTDDDITEKLRERLLKLSPDKFERLVGEYLKAKGFANVVVTQRSHDGGIDGHCDVPFIGVKVAFQAKRYATNTIGIDPVQRLQGSITGRYDRGIFITTSDYTPGAREYVENPTVRITLVNGERLLKELTEFHLGVKAVTVVKYEVDEGFFTDLENRQ